MIQEQDGFFWYMDDEGYRIGPFKSQSEAIQDMDCAKDYAREQACQEFERQHYKRIGW